VIQSFKFNASENNSPNVIIIKLGWDMSMLSHHCCKVPLYFQISTFCQEPTRAQAGNLSGQSVGFCGSIGGF
jgi:hypothetical protein